jgi:hypothetical protein
MKMINEVVKSLIVTTSHLLTDKIIHFSIQETVHQNEGLPMGRFRVDLLNKCCDCGRFQALHLVHMS